MFSRVGVPGQAHAGCYDLEGHTPNHTPYTHTHTPFLAFTYPSTLLQLWFTCGYPPLGAARKRSAEKLDRPLSGAAEKRKSSDGLIFLDETRKSHIEHYSDWTDFWNCFSYYCHTPTTTVITVGRKARIVESRPYRYRTRAPPHLFAPLNVEPAIELNNTGKQRERERAAGSGSVRQLYIQQQPSTHSHCYLRISNTLLSRVDSWNIHSYAALEHNKGESA